ncbi:HEPN domain-containing protein, partial [Streptococcus pluranimalium]
SSRKFKEFIEILSNTPLEFPNIKFLVDYKKLKDKNFPMIMGKYFVQNDIKSKKRKNYQHVISFGKIKENFEHL